MNSNIALTEYVGLLGGIDPAQPGGGHLHDPRDQHPEPGPAHLRDQRGGARRRRVAPVQPARGHGLGRLLCGGLRPDRLSGDRGLGQQGPLRGPAETLQSLGVGPWVKGQVVVAGATCAFAVEALGSHSRFLPMSDYNVAAVQAVVQN